MAATANIQIQGSIQSTASGTRVIGPLTLSSAAANGQVQQITLANGANTITVPTSPAPSGCIIVLPSANAIAVTLKGVSGDTGITIGKTGIVALSWDSTSLPASFVLTAASAHSAGNVTEIIFF